MSSNLYIDKSLTKVGLYKQIIPQIKSIIEDEDNLIANLANISSVVNTAFDSFSWVGFYLKDNDSLILGPFQGEIACTRIDIGKGVCGTSAKRNEAIIVEDVNQFEGHIACSPTTKSELVVPLVYDGLTQLIFDIDSEKLNNFDNDDLNYITEIIDLIKFKHFKNN